MYDDILPLHAAPRVVSWIRIATSTSVVCVRLLQLLKILKAALLGPSLLCSASPFSLCPLFFAVISDEMVQSGVEEEDASVVLVSFWA